MVATLIPAPAPTAKSKPRTVVVLGKGTPAAPPKTTGQIWPRGKR